MAHAVIVAMQILNKFESQTAEFGVRELARDLDVPKSTLHRILASLVTADMLKLDDRTEKYCPGPGLLRFGRLLRPGSELIDACSDEMERLRAVTGETVTLATMIHDQRMNVYELESKLPLRFTSEVNRPYPVIYGATGRVLLAHRAPDEQERIIRRIKSSSEVPVGRPNVSVDELLSNLASVRAKGFAVSSGEVVAGGVAVAVPVSRGDKAACALAVYAPEVRVPTERVPDLVAELRLSAEKVQTNLRPLVPRCS